MTVPVFLTAQIRTGSTFMWHLFQITEDFTAYYEPDLPDLFEFMKLLPVPLDRLHHYHVKSYWDEYEKIEQLPRLHSAMAKEIGQKFCLAPGDNAPAFKQYLDYLANSAAKKPMLEFNRSEFRLSWLQSQFPDSIIIHLWRNPRDQWASMLLGARPQYIVEELNKKIPYLSKVFPVLSAVKTLYRFHYLYHKLSKIAGQAHSAMSICYDDLKQDPHKNIESIFKLCSIRKMTIERYWTIHQWLNAQNH